MRYTTALVLAVASLAAAQSTTSSAATSSATGINQSGCGGAIDAIITNCLASTGARVDSCASTDWDCLCANSQAVLTCYDNCPSDPRRFGEEQTNVSYCNAAKAYGTSSSSSPSGSATSSGSSASQTSGSSASSTASEMDSASSTSSSSSTASSASEAASSATGDSAAGNLAVPAGGVLAAIFGLAAVVI